MNLSSRLSLPLGEITKQWAQDHHIECWYEPTTTSTNAIAKNDNLDKQTKLKIYVTDHQSQGRGRGQNTWQDNANASGQWLCSMRFELPYMPQPMTSAVIGLCLWSAAHSTWPMFAWSLKAPNDLYLAEKKIAGILLETFSAGTQHSLVIGIGMNVFSKPINVDTATCLQEHWQNKCAQLLNEKQFQNFLDVLIFELKRSLYRTPAQNHIADEDLDKLRHALNLYPHLLEPYQQVLSDGSLKTKNKQILWSDL